VAVDRRRHVAYVPAFAVRDDHLSMFQFLLVVHAIVALLLVVVILMQRSEGGGLGMGGSPSGLMSARGAADFLTRATTILATLFVVLSIGLAVYAAGGHSTRIDPNLAAKAPVNSAPAPQQAPLQPGAGPFSAGAANALAPASNSSVPLQH
jgi:preprotein translocase subunit SecG